MFPNHRASSLENHNSGSEPMGAIPVICVGLLGLGTVGAGTYRVLQRNADVITAKTGVRIDVVMVAVRDLARAACVVGADVMLVNDPFEVVDHPDIDVVVETIGGTTLARDLVLRAIANGKHVVTANKALLALHGTEIFAAAQAQEVMVFYEGAVAVSIPIIKALREGLVANRIEWVAGIINGTTNFILSEMKSKGVSFSDALAQAQSLGFAEADPTFDVEGIDAAHKLSLLASNAFGALIPFGKIHIEGITQLESADIAFAESLGYCVKLLGIAKRGGSGLELRVHPTLVPANHMLAQINGAMNAVMVKSDAAGITMYYGAGAGSEETASAVIADLVDVCRTLAVAHRHRVPYLGFQPHAMVVLPVTNIADVVSSYYMRMRLADLSSCLPKLRLYLTDAGVGLRQMEIFELPGTMEEISVVLITEPSQERVLRGVLMELERSPIVVGSVKMIRMDALN